MDKSYRIKTNISNDTILNVNMKQDYDFLEVLTMKLRQKDSYRLHSSNYGVIIGRVLANDAFGIPNAKISLFIGRESDDNETIESIYPYTEVLSKDKDGRRYNLLPDSSDDDCYRVVGTFPNKRLVLDNDSQLEIFDKYWKYTTVTNNAGDYMLFGVPSGSQQLHVDIDLSDVGVLSQKPRDFLYKGYNMSMFDSTSQFKESTNLDGLVQLFSQDKGLFVYPFWGDEDNGVAAITRCDVQIQYKFEPTCVFMGSIISDNNGNAIGAKCAPDIDNGLNSQLVAGEGTIEMIRKTTDGLVEEYQIQGNQLIDSDGVWCYQIPMNLDFIGTDEYGNIVPIDNPNKGIPTRAQVRFRFSKIETGDEGFSRHTAKYLVPMNPIFAPKITQPTINISGQEFEKYYEFGSSTPDSCFRDLYWNNVYSVKNYIPKVQVAHRPYSKNYGALKGSNLVDNQNSVPFNHLRIDMPFMYVIVCIIFDIITVVVTVINGVINVLNYFIDILNSMLNICLPFGIGCLFSWAEIGYIGCISLGGNLSENNVAFYPGCDSRSREHSRCPDGMEICIKSANNDDLRDLVQQRLAEDYKIIKLDFYQDWINGTLYMPLWYWMKRKKKTFLFGLFTIRAKSDFCDCDKTYSRLKTYVNCNIVYDNDSFGVNGSNLDFGENSWHNSFGRSQQVRYMRGLIKGVTNRDNLKVYYYTPMQATSDNYNAELPMSERPSNFKAALLYATDIILLGNLNQDNIYGIPQFFKALPSTTANIPPIASIEEDLTNGVTPFLTYNEIQNGGEERGISVTTGMDWKHGGDKDIPTYKGGLFLDLECTHAKTRSKSCINVERISELGVNLDASHAMQYNTENGVQEGFIDTDGFISKYELEDMENRAMFATMNHIGFIPQTYQESIGSYTTQVEDERTHYLIPKFKYIYPVDFDGRMKPIMDVYKNGFLQSTYDVKDEAYITFRMGGESSNRHFYYRFQMPVYNNSFYFYFGINKGKTAIDKFNKLFYTECVKNSKIPFTLDIESRGKSYCPQIYKDDNGYGYIKVTSDDIEKPYSYTLYSSLGSVISNETDLKENSFTVSNQDLTNQVYTLVVSDANGKTIRERVSLDVDNLSFVCNTRNLGTKFYAPSMTPKSFICDIRDDYFGLIEIEKVSIDGYSFKISDAKVIASQNNCYIITASCTYDTSEGVKNPFKENPNVYFKVTPTEDLQISDCLCENLGVYGVSFSSNKIKIYVYQPSSYSITMMQMCGKDKNGNEILIEDNQTSQLVKINNGDNFNTFLNGMPLRFILGSINDTPNADFANQYSKFYSSNASNAVINNNGGINKDILGWFGVHQEDSYLFTPTTVDNASIWEDYLNIGGDITSFKSKSAILKYKFDNMFKLSNVVYNTSTSNQSFNYTYTGGVEPILTRTLAPYYSDTKKSSVINLFSDSGSVTVDKKRPNIVGTNYTGDSTTSRYNISPRFNGLWNPTDLGGTYLGNYFAGFTKNGRYTSTTTGDCSINISSIPNHAPVNVVDGWKKLGRDMQVDSFPLGVHSSGNTDAACGAKKQQPYLRALTVDRRLDYDLELWGPANANDENIRIHKNPLLEKIWKSSRIKGTLYGGIEMSFDEYENILSANTETDANDNVIFKPNYRLEYTYSSVTNSNSDAITRYNIPKPDNIIWASKGDYISSYLNTFLTDAVTALENSGMPSDDELTNRVDTKINEIIDDLVITYFNIEADKEIEEKETEIGRELTDEEKEEIRESIRNNVEKMEEIGVSAATSAKTSAITDALSDDEVGIINDNIPKIITAFGEISGDTVDTEGHGIIKFIVSFYGDADFYLTAYLNGLINLFNNVKIYIGRDLTDEENSIVEYCSSIINNNWDDKQYLKTLYEADFNGADVRQLFWSTFNEKLLKQYCESPFNSISADTSAVYLYTGYTSEGGNFNGDFNAVTINVNPSSNYPTKRYIDIGNLPQSNYYSVLMTSCGYNMNPQINTDGSITSTVRNGDKFEMEVSFGDPFTFIDPIGAQEGGIYSNLCMIQNGVTEDGFTRLTRYIVHLDFKYKAALYDGFKAITFIPKVISVLSDEFCDEGIYGTDGITYLKTTSNYMYGTETQYHKRRNEVILKNYDDANKYFIAVGIDVFAPLSTFLSFTPGYVDGFFAHVSNYVPVMTRDEEYNEIIFRRHNIKLENASVKTYVFALAVERYLGGENNDTLTKKITLHEVSPLFDARDVFFKINKATCISSTTEYSYDIEFIFKDKSPYYYVEVDNGIGTLYFNTEKEMELSKNTYTTYNYGTSGSVNTELSAKDYGNQTVMNYSSTYIMFQFKDENGKVFVVNGEDIIDDVENGKPFSTHIIERKVRAEFTNENRVTSFCINLKTLSNFIYGMFNSYIDNGNYDFMNLNINPE